MQQFVVPQFIDAEDKILGPITVRQFVIMLLDLFMIFLINRLVTFGIFLVIGIPVFGLGAILAFVKVNGQPFHFFLINVIATFKKPTARIWNKNLSDEDLKIYLKEVPPPPAPPTVIKSAISKSKLSELSLIVNTGGAYQGEDQ